MWFASHALAGMALATRIESIPLLVLSGLGSHVLLDIIPHRDLPGQSWVLLDIATGLAIGYLLWSTFFPGVTLLWWGALFACCPDLEVPLREWGLIKKTYFPSHRDRWHRRWSSAWGLVPNLLVGALSALVLIYR